MCWNENTVSNTQLGLQYFLLISFSVHNLPSFNIDSVLSFNIMILLFIFLCFFSIKGAKICQTYHLKDVYKAGLLKCVKGPPSQLWYYHKPSSFNRKTVQAHSLTLKHDSILSVLPNTTPCFVPVLSYYTMYSTEIILSSYLWSVSCTSV